MDIYSYNGNAPDFPLGRDWFNTSSLSLYGLKGKIVLLSFVRFSSFHSLRILSELEQLKKNYNETLIVILIHTGKFTQEENNSTILSFIEKFQIKFPIFHDVEGVMWKKYRASGFPASVLISPLGDIVGIKEGSGLYETLSFAIEKLENEFADVINDNPREFTLLSFKENFHLYFPTGISINKNNGLIAVCDSGHNRILIFSQDGKIISKIGSGQSDFNNGDFSTSSFSFPMGIHFENDTIYVGDTFNHAIRKINLLTKEVSTLFATGGDSNPMGMSFPLGVKSVNNELFICIAGLNQIWKYNLFSEKIQIVCGSGKEHSNDGKLTSASLAQPSFIDSIEGDLIFTDSESSSIRIIKNDEVNTFIGGEIDVFGFNDGDFESAKFQYPKGIISINQKLFIADSFNNSIRVINLDTEEVETLAGSSQPGNTIGNLENAKFNHPFGLDHHNDLIFITDSHNHSIKIIDLTNNEVKLLLIEDIIE